MGRLANPSILIWTAIAISALGPPAALAQLPDHPIITEVYTNPPGANDGPVGREGGNFHQEFIEIYLPPCAELAPALDCSALNLTFYEVEGDHSSSGLGLVNYRFDLPSFCVLANAAACPSDTIPRPASGVVVLGWVDYVGDPPTALAGTANTRVGLVNGGVTSVEDYVFIPINGHHFGGTTNFPNLAGESLIDLPAEASSGIIQNGSGAYLLVDHDSSGYVELCDDQHAADCAGGAAPMLPNDLVGLASVALLDGFAGNDDGDFRVDDQPLPECNDDPVDCVDLQTVLPEDGAFSLLIAQLPEQQTTGWNPGQANGYARVYVDVRKTTENATTDDPAEDALNAYRHVRNEGPFFPSPGEAVLTTSPPQMSLASDGAQFTEVLSETTGRAGILAANVGGSFGITMTASGGTSSNPAISFSPGLTVTDVAGQTLGFPSVAITPTDAAVAGDTASALIAVTASNSNGGDPQVLPPLVQARTMTATVLKPTTGLDAAGQPFQTTVFVAVQSIPDQAGVLNELLDTDLGQFLVDHFDCLSQETLGNGSDLIDSLTDLRDASTVQPMIKEFPDLCPDFMNPAGAAGTLDLLQTVLTSAEVESGASTYEDNIQECIAGPPPGKLMTLVKAISLNHPDTFTSGGTFSPSEIVHFADPKGFVGHPRSGLSNATSSRTFELVLIDTQVQPAGSLETGATDDFGIIVEVEETEPWANVVDGEFVFLSFTGGLQGADLDTLAVPPGPSVATLIYLDLDNLHDVLGIRSIERIILIDGSGSGEVDVIEVFSLNPVDANPTTDCADVPNACDVDTDGDGEIDPCDDDDDNDGVPDADDPAPLDPDICGDSDGDTCDDCAIGTDGFGPLPDNDPGNDGPDSDGDGICDAGDVCPGGDDNVDSDGDGAPDFCDPCPIDNPDDSDGDGVCDSNDICPGGDDNIDTDGDGTPDFCDPCPLDNPNDTDGDGVCDSNDNCPLHANPDQKDCDEDGMGDVCAIADGFSDDANGNGIPDECEQDCPADLNGDGVVGPADLAGLLGAWGPNPGSPADFNGDGVVGPADLAALLGAWGQCP